MTRPSLASVVVKRRCLLKATLQKSVFVSPLHSRTRLHFICQWSRLFAQDQDSKHFSSQRPANHRRFGISFIFPSSVCKTWKHVVQIRSKKEKKMSRLTETVHRLNVRLWRHRRAISQCTLTAREIKTSAVRLRFANFTAFALWRGSRSSLHKQLSVKALSQCNHITVKR